MVLDFVLPGITVKRKYILLIPTLLALTLNFPYLNKLYTIYFKL